MTVLRAVRRAALVVGTRPEAVKLAPVVLALAADPHWEPFVISTGQHRAVVDEVFALFDIVADRRHESWEHTGELASLHTALVDRLHQDLSEFDVDAVIVQGDTASALAGALAAFWLQIPVIDVEAGLRSADLTAPFPEEANRRLITQISALHLTPTPGAKAALAAEGVTGDAVLVTGNTVIDALHFLQSHRAISAVGAGPPLHPSVLVTCHRHENWGEPMRQVADAVHRLATTHPAVVFTVATHPNPEVQLVFTRELGGLANVEVTGPEGYSSFVAMLAAAAVVLTDSGGVQEEAPAFGVPVLVLRDVTERPEGVTAGVAQLVGTDPEAIVKAVTRLLCHASARRSMAHAVNPYGDGQAARRTVAAMNCYFDGAPRPDEFAGS